MAWGKDRKKARDKTIKNRPEWEKITDADRGGNLQLKYGKGKVRQFKNFNELQNFAIKQARNYDSTSYESHMVETVRPKVGNKKVTQKLGFVSNKSPKKRMTSHRPTAKRGTPPKKKSRRT